MGSPAVDGARVGTGDTLRRGDVTASQTAPGGGGNARQRLALVIWVGVVLAVAAYGAVVVRNVTDMLAGIVDHSRAVALVARPNR